MKTALLLISMALLSACAPQVSRGGSGSHGGDPLTARFLESAKGASRKIALIRPAKLREATSEKVAAWLSVPGRLARLASDIAETPHHWSETPTPRCASTDLLDKAPLYLSIPTCRTSAPTDREALHTVIHESTHHLGVTSESFADLIAQEIVSLSDSSPDGYWTSFSAGGGPFARTESQGFHIGNNLVLQPASSEENSLPLKLSVADLQTQTWSESPMYHPRRAATAAASDDALYFFGGRHQPLELSGGNVEDASGVWDTKDYYLNVLRFDPKTKTFSTVPQPMLEGRASPTVLWTGEEFLIWGGHRISNLTSGARFHPRKGSWKKFSEPKASSTDPLPVTVLWTGPSDMPEFSNKLLIAREREGRILLHLYDPANDAWIEQMLPPFAFGNPNRKVFFESLHAFWGQNKFFLFETLDELSEPIPAGASVWNAKEDQWQNLSTVGAPTPRWGVSITWTREALLLFGGIDFSEGNLLQEGFRYDLAGDRWTRFEKQGSVSARHSAFSIWLGDAFFIWGGVGNRRTGLRTGGLFYP